MKKTVITILALVLIILLFPVRRQIKDGGSIEYRAIVYTVYDVHKSYISDSDIKMKYVEGVIVEIFGIQAYNNTDPYIESITDHPDM